MGEGDADDAAALGTADLDFGEFFVWQYGRLRRLGFLLTGDWDQGEDLAQDALVRTYRAWRRIRTYDHPEHYARKVPGPAVIPAGSPAPRRLPRAWPAGPSASP